MQAYSMSRPACEVVVSYVCGDASCVNAGEKSSHHVNNLTPFVQQSIR